MITARKKLYSNVILLSLLFLFFVFASLLFYLLSNYLILKREREKELASLVSLEKLMQKFPNYPQVYYQAALHAGKLKDNQRAEEYVQRALLLNPGMKEAERLREELEKL